MGSAYLNSGESIILTTHRVSVDAAEYDIMLTNRRIILIDSRYTSFEPRSIALSEIISVKTGITAKGEPVISVTGNDTEILSRDQPLDLVFTQQLSEQRKPECDTWLRQIMEQVIACRQDTRSTQTINPPIEQEPESRPRGATPRGIEMVLPRTSRIDTAPKRPKIILSPDQPEFPVAPVEGSEKPVQDEETAIEIPSPDPVRQIRWPVLKISEESHGVNPQDSEEPGSEYPDLTEYITDDQRSAPPDTNLETPVPPAVPDLDTNVPSYSFPAYPGEAKTDTGAILTEHADITEPSQRASDLPVVPPVFHAGSHQDEAVTGAPDQDVRPGHPDKKSKPSSGHSLGKWGNLAIITAIIIFVIIILAVTGGVFSTPHDSPVQPVITTLPTTTPIPAITTTAAPLQTTPTPAIITIPPEGTWVRISYAGYYIGNVGNPGSLQTVSGTGDQFYHIRETGSIVQASVQKQENSGDVLTVGIYKNGNLITNQSVRTPKGMVSLLIDTVTGLPPGLDPTQTSPSIVIRSTDNRISYL